MQSEVWGAWSTHCSTEHFFRRQIGLRPMKTTSYIYRILEVSGFGVSLKLAIENNLRNKYWIMARQAASTCIIILTLVITITWDNPHIYCSDYYCKVVDQWFCAHWLCWGSAWSRWRQCRLPSWGWWDLHILSYRCFCWRQTPYKKATIQILLADCAYLT